MRAFWDFADRISHCSGEGRRQTQWPDSVIWQGEDLGVLEGSQTTLSISLRIVSLTSSVGSNMLFFVSLLFSEPHGQIRLAPFFVS